MTNPKPETRHPLAQRLAVQTQIHMPGTVGRLLNQIRNLEDLGPQFVQAGLVRGVERPRPLNVRASGIATRAAVRKTLGGFLYAAAAVRIDLAVEENIVATLGQDSTCEIDDIDYEEQSKRFQLIGVRQAYEMADAALRGAEPPELLVLDCPLVLNRSMVPPRDAEAYAAYRTGYDRAVDTIQRFWADHRARLFPWNPAGTVVAGLAAERFSALVHVAQQDLRTAAGRQHLLQTEAIDPARLTGLRDADRRIASVGERRFLAGILQPFTRTAAFRMEVQLPRMEPAEVVQLGVVGFHYRAGPGTPPRILQLVGADPLWGADSLDRVGGLVMALTASQGPDAVPIPVQLAEFETRTLPRFLEHYDAGLREQLRDREVERAWLTDLDEW